MDLFLNRLARMNTWPGPTAGRSRAILAVGSCAGRRTRSSIASSATLAQERSSSCSPHALTREACTTRHAADWFPDRRVHTSMITRFSRLESLGDKEYRHGLVTAQIEMDIPFQLRALRKQRGWTQPELAERAGMKQPRISAMERPGGAHFTLETLRRLAEALDVALVVHFAPFSELLQWSERFHPDEFEVPSFEDELRRGAFSHSGALLSRTGDTRQPAAWLHLASAQSAARPSRQNEPGHAVPHQVPALNRQDTGLRRQA